MSGTTCVENIEKICQDFPVQENGNVFERNISMGEVTFQSITERRIMKK